MTKPRRTIAESTDGFTTAYIDGGFTFTRPGNDPIADRKASELETKNTIKTYHPQNDSFLAEYAYHSYLSLLPDGGTKTALRGLCEAIDMYRSTQEPFTCIIGTKSPKAVIANLHKQRGIESWHRNNDRGVHAFSARVILSRSIHPIVYGDRGGILEIDTDGPPMNPDIRVDEIEYLPMIDGSTDYLVRHNGLPKIALGGAVRPMLLEHGLGHIWDTFISSTK